MMIGIKPKELVEAQLFKANIGEDYWSCDFSNYEGPLKAKKVSMTYLQSLSAMKDQGVGLIYVGPNGPGKTTLAMIVMKYLVRARWNVYTTSLGEVIELIQKSWNGGEDDGTLERCREADFLLIDDVGKEHRGGSGFVQTIFDNLIRHRVQHRKPTFLTTNFTKRELESVYGDSVMSLLEGKLLPVTVDGTDYRRTGLKQQTREAFR